MAVEARAEPAPEEPAAEPAAPVPSIDNGLTEARLRHQLRESRKALAVAERDRRVLAERLQIASAKLENLRGELAVAAGTTHESATAALRRAAARWRREALRPVPWWWAAVGAVLIAMVSAAVFWPRANPAPRKIETRGIETAAPPPATATTVPEAPRAQTAAPAAAPETRPAADGLFEHRRTQIESQERVVIVSQIEGWARAWSEQRVDRYLSYYGREFEPPDGLGRSEWEDLRRQRIESPSSISVVIDRLEITFDGTTRARARFRQAYRSASYRDEVTKTLDLALESGDWRIVRELSEAD